VGEGTLFAAVSGALFDAHKFVSQVMEQGAAGVLSERPVPEGFDGP
jgi:UDP-N-acetylmuramyl pentapeptide synthase